MQRKRTIPLKRFEAGILLPAVICVLMTGCPGGQTIYASDSSCPPVAGPESIPEELLEITKEETTESREPVSPDTTKPTLDATLSGGIITIVARDTESGIQRITVNGTDYTNFTDDVLRIQLTQSDFATEQFVFTATDEAGNVSDRYIMDNPYYNWPNGGNAAGVGTATEGNISSGAASRGTTGSSPAATATTVSGGTGYSNTGNASTAGSTNGNISSPLPQKAEATQPTGATGTVIDRSGTAARAVEASGEEVRNVTQTAGQDGKGFYTIQTKSGKTFYLIVDNTQNTENVYLLTEVSEQDLMNFNLSDTVTLPDAGTVRAEPEKKATVTPGPTVTQKAKEPQMPEKKHPYRKYGLIALLAALFGGAAYYLKVYKPSHEPGYDDEDDEDEAAEYEREEAPYTETLEEEDE